MNLLKRCQSVLGITGSVLTTGKYFASSNILVCFFKNIDLFYSHRESVCN